MLLYDYCDITCHYFESGGIFTYRCTIKDNAFDYHPSGGVGDYDRAVTHIATKILDEFSSGNLSTRTLIYILRLLED